ncbi:hypothetical protein T03_6064 [Trichinella britovi]|uniref:Uncharacterized protein n=1 Tax=Trichinella britovi TaxID=45882 RepID=A0A0V1C894_TRIBR|nr:hypothetical protein T03_6064 [Trichinella britovi]
MVECMGIYSAALCMLTGSDDLCGIKPLNSLCTVPVDLSSSVSCVKLYAQQHFTSCFIVYFSLTPVLGIHFRVYFLFIAVQSRKSYPSEFQQANFE